MRHILILGGTTEARALAARLAARPGRASPSPSPAAPATPPRSPAPTRTGGFGGAEGLARWLASRSRRHPHRRHPPLRPPHLRQRRARPPAAPAPRLLTLSRPPWTPEPGDRWTRVPDMAAAAQALGPAPRARLPRHRPPGGRTPSAPPRSTATSSAASSPPPPTPSPAPPSSPPAAPSPKPTSTPSSATTPSTSSSTKNSGGAATYPKLAAARALAPPGRPRSTAPPTRDAAATVDDLLARLDHLAASTAADRGV